MFTEVLSPISTPPPSTIWWGLPPELVREILFFLAHANEEQARQLRLVSSDVNVLILPVLFRHVVMVHPDHVARFTATLLPKRRTFVPALQSRLNIMPRLLSSYKVESWVLVVNDRRPSIETALASVAPVFCGLSKLVTTGQNLSSNAFWLRHHLIQPTFMMIVHHGSPHLVNFYEPIFEKVTHLYTSITNGHRYSTVADLPSLTHLAVHTRFDLPETTALKVATSLHAILTMCNSLELLVLSTNCPSTHDPRYTAWEGWLAQSLLDPRFVFLPLHRDPRSEWREIVNGKWTVWDQAKLWKISTAEFRESAVRAEVVGLFEGSSPSTRNPNGEEWEIDLVQRDDYQPPDDNPEAMGERNFHLGHF